jgi:antitoxin component YwqK of YwqJK toxin-antitoxin module
MKYLLILLLSTIAFAQETNKLDAQGKKDGLWKGVYEESKRPRYEGTFSHGKEVGTFKFFDDTKVGTVVATREFSDKDNSCYTIFYNQKKNKVSEGKVVNKLFEGEWKYYHEDSDKIMTLENYVNGKLNGVRKVFYKDGKIAEETTYKMDIKNGSYKKYAADGIVFEESNYKNGQLDGPAIFRNDKNVVASKGVFKNGKKEGIWEFNNNGKITKQDMSKPNTVKFVKRKGTADPYARQ